MVLFLDGAPAPSVHLATLLQNETLVHACHAFLSHLPCTCMADPVNAASIILLQSEAVGLNTANLPGLLLGSQDATTCLIVIISCPQTKWAWAAHLDQPLAWGDIQMLSSTLQHMQQPQLYMAGAYCDHRDHGPATAQAFLQLLHSLPSTIHMQLCCVATANTAADGSPCACQLVLDTATQQPHPWVFQDRGPEIPRRFAAQHCRWSESCRLINVWSNETQQLVLEPFDPSDLSSWAIMRYEQMLGWPDEQLLQLMSTSPLHEPPCFCEDMRNMMRFLIEAQEPGSAAREAAGSTSRYKWDPQGKRWCLVTHVHLSPTHHDQAAVTALAPA